MISTLPFLSRLAGRIAILLAAGTLAACQVDVDQGGGYDPGPRMCTREYDPVCGTRRGDVQTFPNACEARSSGFQIVGRGECRPGGRPDPRPDEGRACTREYAPVCGSRGRDRQTFANACEARSSGFSVIGRGECQIRRPDSGWTDNGDGRDRPRDRDRDREDNRSDRERERDRNRDEGDRERPRDQRACTMEYNPVCGQRGRDVKTFGNTCSAGAAGYRVIRPGECPAR